MLIIRPARNLEEGERYIVALRNLKNTRGKPIRAGRGFRIYRDRIRTGARPIEQRRQHFERIFKTLKKAGIKRRSLYLAWDFTVASERSLAGRMLHIRDDAFETLGDTNLKDLKVFGQSPSVLVDTVTDYTPAEDDRIARKVEGHDHGAVLPHEGVRAWRQLPLRQARAAAPDGRDAARRSCATSRARRLTRPRRRRRAPRSTATACSAGRPRSTRAT